MKDILRYVVYGSVFAVPFVLLIVSSSMFFPYITGKNFAFRILVEVAFASWFSLALYDKAYRPRFSYILATIAGLLGVMFLADLLGQYAPKSFWSNYERMEGWVTLLHFFLYFVVVGSIFSTDKDWRRFFNISLIAAGIMSLYALGQASGLLSVSQGGEWRVDGRLGNSSYLGVYMLFQMFIVAWLYLKAKSKEWRYLYGGLFLLFGFILFQTGTRGTTLGLIGGSALAFIYLAIMSPKGAVIKKWALSGLVVLFLFGGGLWALRDSAFIKDIPALSRLANISLSDGNIRLMVWEVALEGVKERPVLGWGQENFNYVFNKYYQPGLYVAEVWYDRTHNIFLDWLIAGGVLGLLAYLAVLIAALFESSLRPLWRRVRSRVADESQFSVKEQALILGLLAGYMFHNLFVFDNLASWIFYAIVLAFIHSRISWPIVAMNFSVDKETIERVMVPVMAVAGLIIVYFVNVPGILAARDIIAAYQAPTVEAKVANFQDALDRGSFAEQEITEQFSQVVGQVLLSNELNAADRLMLVGEVKNVYDKLLVHKPGDARLNIVYGSFYQAAGDIEGALQQFEIAHQISPRKQTIIENQAVALLIAERYDEALEYFKRSYDLDQTNGKARVYYAVGALYKGDKKLFSELINLDELKLKEGPGETRSRERLWYALVEEPLALQAAHQTKNYELMIYILSERVVLYPQDPSMRVNLAAGYYEQGNINKAIEILEKAISDIPAFKTEGESLIKGLRAEQS